MRAASAQVLGTGARQTFAFYDWADVVQDDRTHQRRLCGGQHHRNETSARRAYDAGVADAEHGHEIDGVLHFDRHGIVLPIGVVFRKTASSRVQRENITRLGAAAQRICDYVEVPTVPRETG